MKFFQLLFDQVQAKSGGIIALLADDDTILARSPVLPGEVGAVVGGSELRSYMRGHPGTGSLIYLSSIDGVRRLGSYQHLSQYPLSTLVSQSEWDLQGSWRAELRSHAIILVCVMIVVAVLGSRAVVASRLLNAQAMRDSLTGLANRRFFDATIEREFRRAARTGRPISIIMIDIDHFKDYNDCYGHPAGDECLRAIARTVQDCVSREGEIAARYGGEEIAVILPGSGQPQAYAVAERMRLAVRRRVAGTRRRCRRGAVCSKDGRARQRENKPAVRCDDRVRPYAVGLRIDARLDRCRHEYPGPANIGAVHPG
jgi:diguanylate cyclase (GGDEF)-like protein